LRNIGILVAVFLAFAGGAVAPDCLAQAYPAKPVRLVIPFAPGGATDITGRLVADRLSGRLGQNVVVENRPGAGGQLGTEVVVRAAPDGYTLLLGSADGLVVVPRLRRRPPYDPIKDLTPIALVARSPVVFIASAGLPFKDLNDVIAYARTRPGAVRYGSAGIGSILHLASELLAMKSNVQMLHIPYKGGAPMMSALAAGEIEMAAATAELARRFGDKVRAIGQAANARHPLLPDVPTTVELGLPEVIAVSAFGVVGPAGMPADIVNRLARELAAITSASDMEKQLIATGGIASYMSPGEFSRFIADENRHWAGVIKRANIPLID